MTWRTTDLTFTAHPKGRGTSETIGLHTGKPPGPHCSRGGGSLRGDAVQSRAHAYSDFVRGPKSLVRQSGRRRPWVQWRPPSQRTTFRDSPSIALAELDDLERDLAADQARRAGTVPAEQPQPSMRDCQAGAPKGAAHPQLSSGLCPRRSCHLLKQSTLASSASPRGASSIHNPHALCHSISFRYVALGAVSAGRSPMANCMPASRYRRKRGLRYVLQSTPREQ